MKGLYYLKGPESFLREAYAERITAGADDIRKTDGFLKEDLLWLFEEDLLFGSKKALIIKLSELTANEEMLKALMAFGGSGSVCIICAEKANVNTKLHKWLMAEAEYKKCDMLSEADFDKFVKQRIKHYDIRIRPSAFGYFLDRSCYGYSDATLTLVDTWLHQLSFYDEVTKERIDAVVRIREEQTAFGLSQMLGTKSAKEVLSFGLGFTGDYIAILSAVHYSLRQAYRAKTLGVLESGIKDWQIKKLSGIMRRHPADISLALERISEGICLIKKGMNPADAYLYALGKAVLALS